MSLKTLLEEQEWSRERTNKYKAIETILLEKYPILKWAGSELESIVFETIKMDREWRHILLNHPELRGTDYTDKDKLEEKALIELGYRKK